MSSAIRTRAGSSVSDPVVFRPTPARRLLAKLSRRLEALPIEDDERTVLAEMVAQIRSAHKREVDAEADRQKQHIEDLQMRLSKCSDALKKIAAGRWNVDRSKGTTYASARTFAHAVLQSGDDAEALRDD